MSSLDYDNPNRQAATGPRTRETEVMSRDALAHMADVYERVVAPMLREETQQQVRKAQAES